VIIWIQCSFTFPRKKFAEPKTITEHENIVFVFSQWRPRSGWYTKKQQQKIFVWGLLMYFVMYTNKGRIRKGVRNQKVLRIWNIRLQGQTYCVNDTIELLIIGWKTRQKNRLFFIFSPLILAKWCWFSIDFYYLGILLVHICSSSESEMLVINSCIFLPFFYLQSQR
jgi:hypothetical protein